MKNVLILFAILLSTSMFSQVKIGDNPNAIDDNSILELESTEKVLVVTRITTAQMNAITPINGAIIYNIEEDCLYQYNNSSWTSLCVDVMANETVTSITQNNNGTFTYLDENGNQTIISLSDADNDPTNELYDDTAIQAEVDVNTNNILTNSDDIDTLETEQVTQNDAIADNATNIQNNTDAIDAHVLTDEDTDATNEIQTVDSTDGSVAVTTDANNNIDLSVTPFDDTALQDQITTNADNILTNADDIDALETEQVTQNDAIADNATNIQNNTDAIDAHVLADEDTDATNEIQTVDSTDGSVAVTTDANNNIDLSVTPFDDTALQDQITTNADDIDALETEQVTQNDAIADNATNIQTNSDDIDTLETEQVTQNDAIADNATNIQTNSDDIDALEAEQIIQNTNIQNNTDAIDAHVLADEDTDATNEIQTVDSTDGSVAVTTDANNNIDLSVTPFDDTALQTQITENADDIDALETEQVTQNDAIADNVTNIQNNTDAIDAHVLADEDTDATNEIQTVDSTDGSVAVTTNANNNIDLSVTPFDDTALQTQITENADDIDALETEQVTQNDEIADNATNIQNNTDAIDAHVLADEDTDATNEIQTVTSPDNSVTVTPNGNDFELSVTPFDDTSLQDQITTNADNIQTNSDDIDALETEQVTQNDAIADNATNIQNNTDAIDAHVLADEDTDATNEIQTVDSTDGSVAVTTDANNNIDLSVTPFDDTALQTQITENADDIDALETEQVTQNDAIADNVTNIQNNTDAIDAHVLADEDTDATNEIQTVDSTDGSVAVTTDANNNIDLSVTPFDDTALQTQITENADDIDALETEQVTQNNAIADNVTNIQNNTDAIDAHVLADEDTDATNEIQTVTSPDNSVTVTPNGNDFELSVTPFDDTSLQDQITTNADNIQTNSDDIDALETEQVTQNDAIADNATNIQTNSDDIDAIEAEQIIQNTNIQNNTDAIDAHVLADEDTDATNEIQTVDSTDGSVAVTTDANNNIDLSVTPFDDTSLQDQITTNADDIDALETEQVTQNDAITDNATNIQTNSDDIDALEAEQITQNTNIQNNTDAIDAHVLADEDTDTTNEIQTVDSTDGSVAVTTDANNNIDLSVTPFDDTALQDQITTNADDIDALETEQVTQNDSIADNATNIQNNTDAIDAHVLADEDTDATNEIQTVTSPDNSVTVTPNGNDFELSVTPFDDTALQDQITTNADDIDALETEQVTQNDAIADNATNIQNNTDAIDAHVLADEDTDATNEIQTVTSPDNSVTVTPNGNDFELSVTPFDDTSLQDQITTNADDIDALETEQVTQNDAIADNATNIQNNTDAIDAHVLADEDTDATNEIQTVDSTDGSVAVTTDANNNIDLSVTPFDDTALQTQITENADDIDALETEQVTQNDAIADNATNIQNNTDAIDAHVLADEDTDATNEIQTVDSTDDSVAVTTDANNNIDLSVTPFDDTALQTQITENADDIDALETEQVTQNNAIADNATNIQNNTDAIDAHVLADEDTDATNEIQTVTSPDNSVTVTPNGNDFELSVTPFDDTSLQDQITTNADDIDALETEQVTQNDAISDNATNIQNNTDAIDAHVLADEDTDATNEIQTVDSTDGSVAVTTDANNNIDLSVTPFDDTALQTQITENADDIDALETEQVTQNDAIADNATNIQNNTDAIDAHVLADEDTDATNEIQTVDSTDGSVAVTTDANNNIDLSVTPFDDTALQTQITENADDIDALETEQVTQNNAIADNVTNIQNNTDAIDAHVLADEDTDATNEIQTVTSPDNSVTVTPNGNDFELSVTPFDDTSLQDQITTNADNIQTNSDDIDALETEQVTQNDAITDNATNIQTNSDDIDALEAEQITQNTNIQNNTDAIDAHVLADEDTDATNEIQTVDSTDGSVAVTTDANNNIDLSVTPFDDTALQDQITTNADDIDALETEQVTQNDSIADNATNIQNNTDAIDAHVLADEDTDATNEIQTVTSTDGSVAVTTDANNNIDLSVTIPANNDNDDANELNTSVVLNGTDLETTDAGGTITTDLSSLSSNVTQVVTTGNTIATHTTGGTTTNIIETVTTLAQDDSSPTGEITYTNETGTPTTAQVVSADADNQIKAGSDGGAYLGPTVYTGTFIISAEGVTTITGIPFEPSQVTFVANANVESFNIDNDNGVGNNDRGIDNSHGTMNGFVRNIGGTLAQQVMYTGGHGNSINDISRYASNSNCIGVRYGDQNGSSLGKIEAAFGAFTADGFTLNVDYTDGVITINSGNALNDVQPEDINNEALLVIFTAYK